MKTQCVLMSAIEALKKPVPEPIEMVIQLDASDIQNAENDTDECPLRKLKGSVLAKFRKGFVSIIDRRIDRSWHIVSNSRNLYF